MKKRYFLVLILILLLFCLNTCFAQDNDTSLDNNLITNDNVKITTYDLVKYYQNDSQFVFKVLNKSTGGTVSNAKVTLNINGVFYHKNTDEWGLGKLNINLRPGKYIITLMYDNLATGYNITVLSFLEGKDLVKYYKNDSQYLVKVLDKSGNPLINKTVKMNINGVFYYKATNREL